MVEEAGKPSPQAGEQSQIRRPPRQRPALDYGIRRLRPAMPQRRALARGEARSPVTSFTRRSSMMLIRSNANRASLPDWLGPRSPTPLLSTSTTVSAPACSRA
jgi:hypothetical protein